MSFAKRELEKHDEQRAVATSIAIAAKVLRPCPVHGEIMLRTGAWDEANAYRVGNAKLKAGELGTTFSSPREMTDAVKEVIDDCILDTCPICDKLRED